MNTSESNKKVHHGRNIKRFREMFGMKQEALAIELGEDWSQKKVSRLEDQEEVDDAILTEISHVFKLPIEAFKNFDEQAAISIIANSFNSHEHSTLLAINNNCIINPLEKILEIVEENKKLYEQLLASEREKNALLQQLLDRK